MQKLTYFAEVLAPVKELMLVLTEFRYLHYGPYSSDVQDCLDFLVCHGLVRVDYHEFDEEKNIERARYAIAEEGEELVTRLSVTDWNREHLGLAYTVVQLVDRHGLENLVRLAYQEPTFRLLYEAQAKRTIIPIHEIATNLSVEWVADIQHVASLTLRYKQFSLDDALKVFVDLLWSKICQEGQTEAI